MMWKEKTFFWKDEKKRCSFESDADPRRFFVVFGADEYLDGKRIFGRILFRRDAVCRFRRLWAFFCHRPRWKRALDDNGFL